MKQFSTVLIAGAFLLGVFSACGKATNPQHAAAAKKASEQQLNSKGDSFFYSETKRCFGPVITLSACDHAFRYYATRGGAPDTAVLSYQIETMSGVIVDTGTITNGGLTHNVLNACTSYKITVYDGCWGPQVFTKTSDGCGGVFIC